MTVKPDKLMVPCPDCGELSPEPPERLVENDIIPCSRCAGLIDLASEECRAVVAQAMTMLKRDQPG